MHNRKVWGIKDYIIRGLKFVYRKTSRKQFLNPQCEMDREVANKLIYNMLIDDNPCMIARFGTTEMNTINNYLVINEEVSITKKWFDYITDNTHTPWWDKSHFETMSIYSGIFPPTKETAENFSKRYLNDIPLIDLLGSFQYFEKFMPLRMDVEKVQLETLYPFFVNVPWTKALKGKKVLIVHPFEDSIKKQYELKDRLFDNKDVLPDFELITLKAIQSVAGTEVTYKDWFEALQYMENKISKIDFDICLLGCGAYGLPLAAYVKRLGKKSVHLGGGLQLLFGIKGKRWEDQYKNEFNSIWEYRPNEIINLDYYKLFNENWIYPSEVEKPVNSKAVENSCYWK